MLGLGFCTSLQKKNQNKLCRFYGIGHKYRKTIKNLTKNMEIVCMYFSHLMAGLYVRTSGSKYSSLNGS